jgi:hypothetical protein
MGRSRAFAVATVLLVGALGLAACSDDGGNDTTPSTLEGLVTTTSVAAADASCVSQAQDDDIPAQRSLLAATHLPPEAEWDVATSPTCRWSLTSRDVLTSDACLAAVDEASLAEARTGTARATWSSALPPAVLDSQVETYPSDSTPKLYAQVLRDSEQRDACVAAAVRSQAAISPSIPIGDVEISDEEYDVDPATGVTLVEGMRVEFAVEGDERDPIVLRSASFGTGGVVGTLLLSGPAGVVDEVDLAAVVPLAAADLLEPF